MRPLSIVHALPLFDPATRLGEPVAQLRRLCRALAERGHRVDVVTTELHMGLTTPREQWVEREGFRVWYARAHRFGRFAPYYCPRAAAAVEEALRTADLLHLSLSFTHMNVAGREAALRHGVPYVYSPRMELDPARLRQRRFSKSAFLLLYERAIIRDAAAVHVLTEAEREHLLRQGARPDRIVLIPNGSDLDDGAILPDGAIFRKHFRIHKDAPLVLALGGALRASAIELLVDGFAQYVASSSAARLVVALPDERHRAAVERRADRAGIRRALVLIPRIDGNLRLSALRAADVFAHLAASPGVPPAVLEAAAAGTPLLVGDGCNVPDVDRCGAGRVARPEPGAIAAALREMLADRRALRAMGDAARRMAREKFSFSAGVDQVEHMYRSVAERRAGAPTTRAA
jgi:glycosyltransferase involved in cell wall biosynthesis